MGTEDGKNVVTHAKSKRSGGRGPAVFGAGARVASCSWACRAQGFPWARHEPASGTNQNLACFLLCIMMLWVTTRHLKGNANISLFRCTAGPLLNTKHILSALAELRLGS